MKTLIVSTIFFIFSFVSNSQIIDFEHIVETDTILNHSNYVTMLHCSDGNYLFFTSYRLNFNNFKTVDICFKINKQGDLIWKDTVLKHYYSNPQEIFEKNDNYYIISSPPFSIIQYDKSGNRISDTAFSDKEHQEVNQLRVVGNEIIGHYYSKSNKTYIRKMKKYDLDGNYKEQFTLDSIMFDNTVWNYTQSINVLNNNIVSLRTSATVQKGEEGDGNISPLFLDFYENNGTKIKHLSYNTDTISIYQSFIRGISLSENGNYTIVGNYYYYTSVPKRFIRKYNKNDELLWEKLYEDRDLNFNGIYEDKSGNLFVTGKYAFDYDELSFNKYKFVLIMFDSEGNEIFEKYWGNEEYSNNLSEFMFLDGSKLLLSGTVSNRPYYAQISYSTTNINYYESTQSLMINNPVDDIIYLRIGEDYSHEKIKIYDISGNMILEKDYTSEVNFSKYPNGTYFILIGNKKQKFIKY